MLFILDFKDINIAIGSKFLDNIEELTKERSKYIKVKIL